MRQRGVLRRPSTIAPTVPLAAILAAFLALSSVIAIKTPAWENADEPGHVYNIEQLVSGHWYRIPAGQAPGADWYRDELHQPPLYYLVMAAVQRAAGEPARSTNPGPAAFPFVLRGLYLHHSSSRHRFLLSLRLPNLAFGLITILFTFLSVRMVTEDKWTPVIAAAICAFLPTLLFLSAFVTNDNLVTALGAVLTFVALRCVRSPTTTRTVVLGAVAGLVPLAKLTMLPALAVLVWVVALRRSWASRLRCVVLLAVPFLVVCGWYLTRNVVLYGDPLALKAAHHYLVAIHGLGPFTGAYIVTDPLGLIFSRVPQLVFRRFWYTSGWYQFVWPPLTDAVYWVALLVALLGLLRPLRQGPEIVLLAILAVMGFVTVWIVAFTTSTYEPRLGFYSIPALAGLAALGLERWRLPFRLVLPAMELIGAAVAIQQNVLSVRWY